jgi:ankyrin repeat protein
MKTIEQVLEAVAHADVFLGATVDSVHTERLSGETPLHVCAKWGDAEAIRVLVAHGAVVGKPGEDSNTPLHYAAMFGHLAAVRELVAHGAPNTTDRYGNYPVDLAAEHPEVQVFLRSSGYAA